MNSTPSVKRSQKNGDFCEVYDARCELHKTSPLPIIKAYLKEKTLDLNADKLSLADWEPFLESFQSESDFKFIGIRSFSNNQNDLFKVQQSRNKTVPSIKSPIIVARLCEELETVIGSSLHLACLELQNIQLTVSDLIKLAKGIHINNTIRHLSLEQCPIDDNSLQILAQVLNKKMNITSINFSQCGLKSKSAQILAEVIQNQSMFRHGQSWKDSLRYRNVDLDAVGGLRRLTLNRNSKLGNRGAEAFGYAIKDDVWLKALDLTSCGISDSGANTLLRALAENSVLQVLDVRQNPIMDKTILLRITQQLNFNTQGHQSPLYKWLNLPSPNKNATKKGTVSHRQHGAAYKKTSRRTMKQYNLPKQRGIPWHVAARFGPERGLPSRFVPGVANAFLQTATISSESEPDDAHVTNDTPTKRQERHGRSDRMKMLAKIQEDLNVLRECLNKEVAARREAERKVAELMKKNEELEEQLSRTRRMSDDEAMLATIQETFAKFYDFLAVLQKAGLGKLVAMSGFTTNDSDQQGHGDIPNLAMGDGHNVHGSASQKPDIGYDKSGYAELLASLSARQDVSGDMSKNNARTGPSSIASAVSQHSVATVHSDNHSHHSDIPLSTSPRSETLASSSNVSSESSRETSTISTSSQQIEIFTSGDEF